MIKYNCNVCDRIYNEIMIHFTKDCPNNCPFCIDKRNAGINSRKPKVNEIYKSIEICAKYIDTVTISGGEPCLYMDELYELVSLIKNSTQLKVNIVTSIPKECVENKELFYKICELCDNIQISFGHYNPKNLVKIFGNKHINGYGRNEFINEFPYKDKTTISMNVVKGLSDNKDEILRAIKSVNWFGYKDIKICEMFDSDNYYVDIPKTLGIKMKSPFAHGCKTEYDITKLIPSFDGTLTIKRTCFLRTNCQKASLSDCFKMLTKYIKKKEYFFGVIHEDGTIAPYWI
jgi:pyruvate-formate lyase-activating enzyme